ncbi:MAG: hypothetical protein ACREJR_00355 [Candidatus Rokuibacteriota bacterium]
MKREGLMEDIKCPTCGKSLQSQQQLDEHYRIEHGMPQGGQSMPDRGRWAAGLKRKAAGPQPLRPGLVLRNPNAWVRQVLVLSGAGDAGALIEA